MQQYFYLDIHKQTYKCKQFWASLFARPSATLAFSIVACDVKQPISLTHPWPFQESVYNMNYIQYTQMHFVLLAFAWKRVYCCLGYYQKAS